MRRFLNFVVVGLLCTIGACCPKGRGAELPQSTLKALPLEQVTLPPIAALPQSTLKEQCRCIEGGKCTCTAASGCQCGDNCTCPACPGKVKLVAGQSKDHDGAVADAIKHKCPAVFFVNLPARSVPGAVCCREDGPTDKRARIVVWTPYGGTEELSPKVTDADIQESIGRCAHATVSKAGLHSHRCPSCGNVWSHGAESYGNVGAHSCPRCGCQSWQPIPYVAPRAAMLPMSGRACST